MVNLRDHAIGAFTITSDSSIFEKVRLVVGGGTEVEDVDDDNDDDDEGSNDDDMDHTWIGLYVTLIEYVDPT